MRRMALTVCIIGGTAVWVEAQSSTGAADQTAGKVDRAAAYYHYALACWYSENAVRNPEYANKAVENYKAAVKADPQGTPGRMPPRFILPNVLLQAPRQKPATESK